MVSIFVSRKTSDILLAQKFKEVIENEYPDCMLVDIAEQLPLSIEPTNAIIKQVRNCDWLVLLWTDRFENWTWPVFETGIHFGKSKTRLDDTTRFYVLHHPNDIPDSPLGFWTRVPINEEGVDRFLTTLHQKGRRLKKVRSLETAIEEAPRLIELKQAILERYSKVWIEKKKLARDLVIRFVREDLLNRDSRGFPQSTRVKLEGDKWAPHLVPTDEYLSLSEFETKYEGLRIVKSWQHCVAEGVVDVNEPGEDLTLGLPLLRLERGVFDDDEALLLRGAIRRICTSDAELRVRICFSETPCYLQMPRDELVSQLIRLLETLWQIKSTCHTVVSECCTRLKDTSDDQITSSRRIIRILDSSIQNARAELAARGYDRVIVQSNLDGEEFKSHREIALQFRKLFLAWDEVTKKLDEIRFPEGVDHAVGEIEETNAKLIGLTSELSKRVADTLQLLLSSSQSPQTSPQSRGTLNRFLRWLKVL